MEEVNLENYVTIPIIDLLKEICVSFYTRLPYSYYWGSNDYPFIGNEERFREYVAYYKKEHMRWYEKGGKEMVNPREYFKRYGNYDNKPTLKRNYDTNFIFI